jgi:thiosulfate/3-mercaptopyruvate sulfurtransferase
VVDRAHVQRRLGRAVLLDARAPERFRGEVEPIDPRPGHIPGATSAPFAGNLGPDGRWLPAAALRARYEAFGAGGPQEVIVYCGSGVTACHDLLAIAVAGLPAPKLYEGSWSDWARDPTLPAALGSG